MKKEYVINMKDVAERIVHSFGTVDEIMLRLLQEKGAPVIGNFAPTVAPGWSVFREENIADRSIKFTFEKLE